MKLLSTFTDLGTPTSSGATSGFPVTNIEDLDPMVRWKADAYAGDVWVKADMASAQALTALFLNRCNFPQCRIQGHASDDFTSPSFNQLVSLVQDDAGNRKGWFDLTAFNYRWLRILIASGQTLDNSDTLPAIGNLIVGASAELPVVAAVEPRLLQRQDRFEPDGGGLSKQKRGRARHIISVSVGDSLANVRAMAKTWDMGVIFADLDDAGEAWLVYPPEDWTKPIKSVAEAELRFILEERP